MFQATPNEGSTSLGLDAGLLIGNRSEKYANLWRKSLTFSLTVSIFISLRKPTSESIPVTQETSCSNSLQQDDLVPGNGILDSLISTARNSFSGKSCGSRGSTSTDYHQVPSSPVDQPRDGSLSAQHTIDINENQQSAQHVIGIPFNNEEEEKSEEQLPLDPVAVDRNIVKRRDLNLLKKFGGIQGVARVFRSHLENGILDVQDQPPVLEAKNPIGGKYFFYLLWVASIRYTIFFLVVSAGLSFATGVMKQGPRYGWHDGVFILVAVLMLVISQSVSTFRQARKLEQDLRMKNEKFKVQVVRGGQQQSITISDVVAGDLVHLKEGSKVPGDGLVVSSNGLDLDDVLHPKIDCDQNPFLFYGSKVVKGDGSMLVTSKVGNREMDELLRLGNFDPQRKRLLDAQTEKPNAYIENLSLGVSLIILLVAFIRVLRSKHKLHNGDDEEFPELKGNVSVGMLMKMFERILFRPQGTISILVRTLTAVVVAIQHGMPFVITYSLSFWNEKLVINGVNPQNLSAGATMAIVTVICIDATGGLVCNDMGVNKFLIGEKYVENNMSSEIDKDVIESLKRGIGALALVPEISVHPTNDLFVSWAKLNLNLSMELLDQNLSMVERRNLNHKKGCGVLLKTNGEEEKGLHIHWSGDASTILDMCSHYYDNEGNSRAISDEKSKLQDVIKDMEDSGLRPVGFACKQTEVEEIQEDELQLLALAGLKYPCIELSVEDLRDSGVRVKLISEDKLSAARAIAHKLGIFTPETNVVALEGDEQFQCLTRDKKIEKLDKMTVMGSCLAKDKLLLVQSMQKKGHIVAFLGGSSTFDSPALKKADVGITKDTSCSEMARESCDIIISAGGSLRHILMFGRYAYNNIQKFSQLQLTFCLSSSLIIIVSTLSLEESPITTIQLIWVYWIVCILGGVMMVMDLTGKELFTNSVGRRTQSLVTKVMWKNIVVQVLCQAFVLLIFQFKRQVIIPSLNNEIRKSIIFSSFTLCQVFNQFNTMGLGKKETLMVVLRDYTFLVALGTVMVVQVLIVEFAGRLFPHSGCERLNGMQWGICFLLAALSWGIHCGVNLIPHLLLNLYSISEGSGSGIYLSRMLQWSSIPFTMFIFLTYYYSPDVTLTFH